MMEKSPEGGDVMLGHKLRGSLDRLIGFNREFWGEVLGSGREFRAGQRQRLIGRLEADLDLDREEAQRRVDRTLQ